MATIDGLSSITCAICLDIIENGERIQFHQPAGSDVSQVAQRALEEGNVETPPSHVFHTECLSRWFQTSGHKCPTCRVETAFQEATQGTEEQRKQQFLLVLNQAAITGNQAQVEAILTSSAFEPSEKGYAAFCAAMNDHWDIANIIASSGITSFHLGLIQMQAISQGINFGNRL
jgi:hypothetical protein